MSKENQCCLLFSAHQGSGGVLLYRLCGCGGCVLTRERAFVHSCTCYDCYLTSNLPSKPGSEVAFIAA